MPNEKTDQKGFATNEPDQDRDLAAKGGPGVGLGRPGEKHTAPDPLSDPQTQIVIKSKKKKKDDKDPSNDPEGLNKER